jgi:hypothetical protein
MPLWAYLLLSLSLARALTTRVLSVAMHIDDTLTPIIIRKCKMHNNNTTFMLGSAPPLNPVAFLAAGANLDMAVEYELSEVGVHTYVVVLCVCDDEHVESIECRDCIYVYMILDR